VWYFEICFHRLCTVIEKSKTKVLKCSVKAVYNVTARDETFFVAATFLFTHRYFEVLIFGPPDIQDRSNCPLKIGFSYAQVAFETDFDAVSCRLV
jgi:hypothetical protein